MIRVTFAQQNEALAWLLSLWGESYGHAEAKPGATATEIAEIDCSELAERLFVDHLGVRDYPDGSMIQLAYCVKHGRKLRYPEDALQQFDLLFLTPSAPGGMGHVAIVVGVLMPSQGGGIMLMEARGGKKWGNVIYSPLKVVVEQFKSRFAGIYRLVELEAGPV